MPSEAMAGMDHEMMSTMPPEAMAGMDHEMMSAMPSEAMAGMDHEMMQMMPPEAMAGMDHEMMSAMPSEAMAAMGDGMSPAEAKVSVMEAMDPEVTGPMDDHGLGALSAALEPQSNAPPPMMDATSEALDLALAETQPQGGDQAADAATLDQTSIATETQLEDFDENIEELSGPDETLT